MEKVKNEKAMVDKANGAARVLCEQVALMQHRRWNDYPKDPDKPDIRGGRGGERSFIPNTITKTTRKIAKGKKNCKWRKQKQSITQESKYTEKKKDVERKRDPYSSTTDAITQAKKEWREKHYTKKEIRKHGNRPDIPGIDWIFSKLAIHGSAVEWEENVNRLGSTEKIQDHWGEFHEYALREFTTKPLPSLS